MEQIHDRVAGLDVHRDNVAACARVPGQRKEVVSCKERFSTTTVGLGKLAEWLGDHQVHLVGMEATGVYWKPLVRHEAPCTRVGRKESHLRPVAAGR